MEARAQARYVRVTPMKARRVIDLIRGMQAGDAQDVLRFAPQAASESVGKVLASAIANATNNHGMQARDLVIAQAFVMMAPRSSAFAPRARTCHRVGSGPATSPSLFLMASLLSRTSARRRRRRDTSCA